ncbi:hypothetical protein [Nonomuraea helvata]|uniref:XRE family transcriptional regulator n=1 Tax=Nonomuraea helvata TaxID=37484 RepID=A0ABV5SCM8_9ACTN
MSEYPEGGKGSGAVRQAPPSQLESVTCHEDLVKLLAEQFARADTSLRELQLRADKAGGTRLPRATCADMLAGRRFPKKALMVAFLRACQVPEGQLPAWERAWERLRVSRMPAGREEDRRIEPPGGAAPAAQTAGPGRSGPTGVLRRGPRRAVVSAVLTVLAAALTVSVIIDQLAAPQRDAPDRSGSSVDPGHVVSDDGRAFGPRGSSRFTVSVDPANTGVRLIRRLDVGVAWQHATITVNGEPAGAWRGLPGDSTYKWRDQVVELPRALTAGRRSLTIVNRFVSSSLGFNEFRYVVEQRVNGAWSTADTVDVGPHHAASEAAHDYRIAGEGWTGPQTFTYPPREEDWRVE